MCKRLICFITTISFIFVFAFSSFGLSSSAYISNSSLYNSFFSSIIGPQSFTFSSDGVLLIHSFIKTSTDVESLIPSERNLDLSYFDSGTWQGSPISELSSNKICDQSDTVGFSQTVSCTYDSKWFIYSVVICLPCVAGDSFSIRQAFSKYAYAYSSYSYCSVIYGASSVKKVYSSSSAFYTDEAISYTTKSDNQYLICLYSADKFDSTSTNSTMLISNHSDSLGSGYSNITKVASSSYASVYTSTYGLSSGTELALHLKANVTSWNFSVYEIFTDGTFHPGYDDGSVPDDSGGGGSSSDQIEISNNILTNIKNILSLIADLPQKIVDKIGNYFTDLKNSFVSAIENLRNKLLEGIEYLFMPSDNHFLELEEVIKEKFKFFYQIIDLVGSVVLADVDVPPNNKITFYGEDIVFMDWTLYANYKPLIDRIIIIVSYYFYFQRLIKRIPGVIGGIHS